MKINLTILILFSILSIVAITTSLNSIYAQENVTEHVPKFLAIQHAKSGSISEINETAYSLELNDVSDKTILFSDRPDRIVKSVSTADFIGNWSVGENNYAIDAPNTVLIIDKIERDGTKVELFNPNYDVNEKTLKYDVTPDNTTSIDLPQEFGQIILVIDDASGPDAGNTH